MFSYTSYKFDSDKLYAFGKADLGALEVTTRTEDSTTTGSITIGGVVTLCNPGCTACSAADASICSQCGGGYYFDAGKCVKIRIAGCRVPSGTDSCGGCFEGFYLVTSTTPVKCTRCSDSCLTCSSATTCLSCNPGSALKAGVCVACIEFCDDCLTPTAPAVCTTCSTGYTYNSETHSCDQCPIPGCSTCTATTCSKCAEGFELSSNKCVACPSGCKTCASGVCSACRG